MKIARAGFAMRYPHAAFIQRYCPIIVQELRCRSRRFGGCELSCQGLIDLLSGRLEHIMRQKNHKNSKIDDVDDLVSWGVQIGKSKVFLRTSAFEALEDLRNASILKATVLLQARGRAFLCQNRYYLTLGSILTLQCAARRFIALLRVQRLRFSSMATTIQKCWRRWTAWFSYQNVIYLTTCTQRIWRGKRLRKRFTRMKQFRSAIIIQTGWRSHIFQQCHRETRNAVITIQCFLRVCASSRALKRKRREAKDVQSIVIERDQLRREMRQMKRELEQVKHRSNGNMIQQSDSWTTARTTTSEQEEKIRYLSNKCAKNDQELRMLRQEVESLREGGRSVPSSLPSAVIVDDELPFSTPARLPSVDPSLLPSGESSKVDKHLGLAQPNLFSRLNRSKSLIDPVTEDVPELAYSQSSLPDSSIDNSDEIVNMSNLNRVTESSFVDFVKIEELPFHQAVQNNDREMLLKEILNSSDIELNINSIDSMGR